MFAPVGKNGFADYCEDRLKIKSLTKKDKDSLFFGVWTSVVQFPNILDISFTVTGADLERGANHSSESLKQGVWGVQPPEAIGYFVLRSTEMPPNARFKSNLKVL